tara:strand:- start:360 stop:3464 length:3105 start_codon:yes stop_codon:yes gene_type:complete
MSNIVGTPFRPFVKEQITARQGVLAGSGSLGGRDERFLKYVSKTPWLRMASSIDIEDAEKLSTLNLDNYGGIESAKNFVLQGGALEVFRQVENDTPSYVSPLGLKYGVSENASIVNSNVYGFGGSDFGKTPMPGLTSINIQDFNRGALRKATINFVCTSIQQLEIISALYMRIGYHILVEWGHTIYLNNQKEITPRLEFNTPAFTSFFEGKDQYTILDNIQTETSQSVGNYDGFMGRLTNFSWKFVNGAYECSVDALSQGDVIDSLKANTSIFSTSEIKTENSGSEQLIPDVKSNEERLQEVADIALRDSNIIGNILYNNKIKLDSNIKDNSNVIQSNGFTDFLKFSNGLTNKFFFVSLGALLRIIEDNTLLYDSNKNSPIIKIDKDYETNFCARFPEQVSTDWSKCYIPYKVFDAKRKNYASNPKIDKLLGTRDFRYDKSNYVGRLMCIFLNVDFVFKVLTKNTDQFGNISIQDFITDLLKGVQESTGGINDFQTGYDPITNSLKIYDNSPLVSDQLVNQRITEPSRFQSYGVQVGQAGSFLLNVDLSCTLPKTLQNMAAAGAQFDGNQIGANATAFSLWNKGLIDRTRKTDLDAQTLEKAILQQSSDQASEREQKDIKQAFFNNKEKLYRLLVDATNTSESDEDLRNKKTVNHDFAQYYLGLATTPKIGNSNLGLPGNFFLPFDLGLTMDGLSGMRLFEKFSITNEILPQLYTDALTFIINGINHSITSAGWTTKISSQTYNQFTATKPDPLPTSEVTTRGISDIENEKNYDTPNADFLRSYYTRLGINEKQSGNDGLNPGTIVPGPQLSNGGTGGPGNEGDITKELAFATIELLQNIRSEYPAVEKKNENGFILKRAYPITITGGNDLYHQNKISKTTGKPIVSNHKLGKGLDFTIIGGPDASLQFQRVIFLNYIKPFVAGNSNFNAINEYATKTENATGGHFHIEYGTPGRKGTKTGKVREEAETASSQQVGFAKTFNFSSFTKEYEEFLKEREKFNTNPQSTPEVTTRGINDTFNNTSTIPVNIPFQNN